MELKKKRMCPHQQEKKVGNKFNKGGHTLILNNFFLSSYWKTYKLKLY